MADLRVTTRNARFQQWEALLGNRSKRQRAGEFLVQGVRPISLAVRFGWEIRELLYDVDARLSEWARETLEDAGGTRYAVAGELMAELGGKEGGRPELLAVVGMPADDVSRIPVGPDLFVVVLDRPTSPGNVGTVIRSADALGATGVIVTGHAADIYDPKCVRASTGSLFSAPVLRVPSYRPVLEWRAALRSEKIDAGLVGTDEHGDIELAGYDFARATVAVVGNETTGLSAAWREACDHLLRIPITGAASSLNAATAASIVMYERVRQRGDGGRPGRSTMDGRMAG